MYIALIVVGVILLAIVYIYNSLVRVKVRTDEAWSDITVQMKRRFDLIPNLVESVKAYAKHESTVFQKVTEARANSLGAQTVGEVSKAEGDFQKLQDEVTDTEDKIQAARRFYNGAARDLNIKIQSFPMNIMAGMMGFKVREFFEVPGGEAAAVKEPVKVDFAKKES